MFNPETVRKDFPSLEQLRNRKKPIYFDTACTSLKPHSVINACTDYYSHFPGCAERSTHWFAEKTQVLVDESRKNVAAFLNAFSDQEIVFTPNTTASINLIAHQLHIRGGIVVVSDKEHNSNFLPWQQATKNPKVHLEIIPTDPTSGALNLKVLEERLAEHTEKEEMKIVSTFLVSNFDGSHNPVETIAKMAKKYGFLLHLDAAQAASHIPLDVQQLGCDLLSFSGHKTLGPTGIGVLWGKSDLLETFEPYMVGGGTPLDVTDTNTHYSYPPKRFEAGIQNYAGIIGLNAAISYLTHIPGYHESSITAHAQDLNALVTKELRAMDTRIGILGSDDPQYRPTILAFTLHGVHAQQVAYLLNEKANIMTRAGRHCVHAYCNKYHIAGSVRLSFYAYNTRQECETFLGVMEDIIRL